MASNFPTSLDALINPTATDQVAVIDHALQHANANDAIEALQVKVGINGSAVTTTHDYKLSEVTSTDKAVGKTATQTLTNKTIDADSNTITNIDNGNIKSGANIERAKIATGTAGAVLINDGSGIISEEAQLDISRGGTGQGTPTDAFDALAPNTTKGDLIVHDGTDNIRVGVGSDNTVLIADSAQASGVKWGLVGTLGLTKIYQSTSFSSPVTVSIPGGTLGTNNTLRVTLLNALTSCTSGQTVTIQVQYGGQSVGTLAIGSATGATSTNEAGRFTCYINASGATNTQSSFSETIFNPINASTQPTVINQVNNTSMTVDSTVSQNLVITQAGTGTMTCQGVLIELIS